MTGSRRLLPCLQMPVLVCLMWVSLDVDLCHNLPSLQTKNNTVVLTTSVPPNLISRLLSRQFSLFLIQRQINYFHKTTNLLLPPPPNAWKEDRSRTPVCSLSQQLLLFM